MQHISDNQILAQFSTIDPYTNVHSIAWKGANIFNGWNIFLAHKSLYIGNTSSQVSSRRHCKREKNWWEHTAIKFTATILWVDDLSHYVAINNVNNNADYWHHSFKYNEELLAKR